MNIIRRWFDNERKVKAKRAYLRGHDWAAGMLLRGVSSDDVCRVLDGETPIEFDNGVLAACKRYEALTQPHPFAKSHLVTQVTARLKT